MFNNTDRNTRRTARWGRLAGSLVVAVIAALTLFASSQVQAQLSQEFFVDSMRSIPMGPTTAPQTATLAVNTDNPTGNAHLTGSISVTATLSNQAYTGSGTGAGNPVVMFGGTANGSGTTANSIGTFAPMSTVGLPQNGMFSSLSNGAPQGIDVLANYSFNFFTSIQHWLTSPPPTNGVYRMATLTLTFSQPVTDPYIQVGALGALSANSLGMSTELVLLSPGLSLESVTGSHLGVAGTRIYNTLSKYNDDCVNDPGAACGTVRVKGTDIRTIAFDVYIRGDGTAGGTWAAGSTHTGDQWTIGVSLTQRPTAAGVDIGGQVTYGQWATPNARVTLMDLSNGEITYAATNAFGYYRFQDLKLNNQYMVTVTDKRRGLVKSRNIELTQSMEDFNFDMMP